MKTIGILNATKNTVLAKNCAVATTFWQRSIGLLNRRRLDPGEALLIERCGSIHTLGMRFAIDAAFLDAEWRVLKIVSDLKPWRPGVVQRGAVRVLELPAGVLAATGTTVGDHLNDTPQI